MLKTCILVGIGACSSSFRVSERFQIDQTNGFNESFNGKLRGELLNGEIFYTLKEATGSLTMLLA